MAQTGLSESAILMAWAGAGVISLLGAFSVGGLASLTDESGGSYEYLRLSFGKLLSFLSGWADFMIMGTGPCAALAFLFSQTIDSIAPIPNPLQSLEHVSIANFIFPFANFGVKMVAVLTLAFLTVVNCIGTRESGVINNIVTSTKIAGILALVFFGIFYSHPEGSAMPEAVSQSSSLEGVLFYSAFFSAMLGALWAYDGWIYAANISGEIVDPKRNVPLSLSLGILISITLFLLANLVYMHVLPLDALRSLGENDIGAVVVIEFLAGNNGRILLLILILICVLGALNSNVISVPRKYYRMAQEGYFFQNAKRLHPRFKTPHVAFIYCLVWSSLLLISGSFDLLTDMVVFTGFVFYGLLCVALIRLKRNGTIKEKVIGYPFAPIVFLLFSATFTINTILVQPKESLLGLLLILSGVPFYYYFKKEETCRAGVV